MLGRARRLGKAMRTGVTQRSRFHKDFTDFQKLSREDSSRFDLSWRNRMPMLDDRTATTGFPRDYLYHTAWAARILRDTMPAFHVDISSSLYFAGIVSAFVPIRFYDWRPANLLLSGLTTGAADLTNLFFEDGSINSLSCMHVVEHVGLGRYGDPLDPQGDLKAIRELKRVVAPGGSLLFVVPIGKARIFFNAHRVYRYHQIIEYFADLELHNFALIHQDPNKGGLIVGASSELCDAEDYGCGCFWFRRPA